MTDHVAISQANGVLEILWNRPEKKNALSQAMYAKASDALDAASKDPAVRVVLLGSTGETFTSGNDLSDFAAANDDSFVDLVGFFCNPEGCLTRVGPDRTRDFVTFDYGHLTPPASKFLARGGLADRVLAAAGAAPLRRVTFAD